MKKARSVHVGGRTIAEGRPVFIIAEAGVNHNGKLELAKKLIDAAAEAGADAVKFQTFTAQQVVTQQGIIAAYQRKNIGVDMKQQELLRGLEFKEEWYKPLMAHAKRRGIMFFSTPHGGFPSIDLLSRHHVSAFKFGSGDLTNLPALAYAARLKKPMFISTGMATFEEVKDAIRVVLAAGNSKIVIMHATTDYPTIPEEVNIRVLGSMKKLGVLLGYSDHTLGTEASVAAVALGAQVLEKHFTLDRSLPGPDHKASLEPAELTNYINAIRALQPMLGDGVKRPQPSELKVRDSVRKSIVTAVPIGAGEVFTKQNLAIKRPGTGLKPKEWTRILGKKAARALGPDHLLTLRDIR
jgi:N,N'-diacetyllegionaminate synthase